MIFRRTLTTYNKYNLHKLGLHSNKIINYNLSYSDILKHEERKNEGKLLSCKYGNTYL